MKRAERQLFCEFLVVDHMFQTVLFVLFKKKVTEGACVAQLFKCPNSLFFYFFIF